MKPFLKKKIDKYVKYLNEDLPILEDAGEILAFLDFNFDDNSDEFIQLNE